MYFILKTIQETKRKTVGILFIYLFQAHAIFKTLGNDFRDANIHFYTFTKAVS